MTPQARETCAAFVGLAGADAQPDMCCQAAGTARRALLGLAHRPAASEAWGQPLRPRFHGPPVAVCLERKKGPLVSARRASDFLGRFPVNPFTLAQDRAALTPRQATDAPTEAALQVALLLTHRDPRTPLSPHSPTLRP